MKNIKATLTPDQIHSLKNQTFTDSEPGTLLKDFSTLLGFIGSSGIPVSGKSHLIAIKLLPQLNQLMSHPLDVKLKRPQQKSFPHLNGLYLLLRASGLTQIVQEKKEAKLMLDNNVLADWQSLNLTERYFALFHAWWLRGRAEIIGESSSNYSNGLYDSLYFFQKALNDGLSLKEKPHDFDYLRYNPCLYNLALMELFGFIRIEQDSELSGENWPVVNITPTTWGRTLLNHLSKHLVLFDEHVNDQSDYDLIVLWNSELKSYIPTFEKSLKQPEIAEIQHSSYVFKVSLGSAYRKIAAPGTTSLEELAGSILSAFNFDNDHLYEFIYKNRYGITERIVHPYIESDELCTTDCVVGELSFYKGMELTFHFDFGDDWRFQLVVESIASNDSGCSEPTVIEQHGNPPEQYPDWDD
ncbi:plasmid pRiA4b ORF-3 family protein [Methylobacter psychrophilus]|uniref:plasmid pRiA4b ORF-3 family protein n=1 Tax=Methylobacter psychrophilus TaxID=96941 RepID=UPI0021D4F3B5|nr:plasmid pRiA4b ORF-3 family protein [Methylobacter psychrophilus]